MRFRCSSQVGSTLLLGLACLYSAPVPRTRRQSTADAAGDLLTCVGQPDPLYKHMHGRKRIFPLCSTFFFDEQSQRNSLEHTVLRSVRDRQEWQLACNGPHRSPSHPFARRVVGVRQAVVCRRYGPAYSTFTTVQGTQRRFY